MFEWRAGTGARAKRRKGNRGDGENKGSSRARAAASKSDEGQRAHEARKAQAREQKRSVRTSRATHGG